MYDDIKFAPNFITYIGFTITLTESGCSIAAQKCVGYIFFVLNFNHRKTYIKKSQLLLKHEVGTYLSESNKAYHNEKWKKLADIKYLPILKKYLLFYPTQKNLSSFTQNSRERRNIAVPFTNPSPGSASETEDKGQRHGLRIDNTFNFIKQNEVLSF